MMGSSGPNVIANLQSTIATQYLVAFFSGVIFLIGAFLLIYGVLTIGMAISIPICMVVNVVFSAIFSFLIFAQSAAIELSFGIIFAVLTILFGALAAKKREASASADTANNTPKISNKGIALVVGSGFIFSFHFGMIQSSMTPPNALNHYNSMLIANIGFFCMSICLAAYLLKKYDKEKQTTFKEFFTLPIYLHGKGFIGGIIWNFGTTALLITSSVSIPQASYIVWVLANLTTILVGLFYWKELKGVKKGLKSYSLVVLFYILTFVSISLATNALSTY